MFKQVSFSGGFRKIPGNYRVHSYFPSIWRIFEKTYDCPYWSTVSVSQWMELFFTSVFVHPLLVPAAGLERDVQVAREELTQNTFWGPRAQIVLKLVASWPDKWCHIIMLVTYKSGLNGHYVSPRLCSMARNFHIPMAVSITTKSKMGNDASRKKKWTRPISRLTCCWLNNFRCKSDTTYVHKTQNDFFPTWKF